MTLHSMRTSAIILGLTVLMPIWVYAQTPTNTSVPGVRANSKVQVSASTTPRNSANLETRLVRAKEKAAQEIERRTAALTRLIERIAAMKRVSAEFKSSLSATINTEIADLTALRVRIESSTNGEEIKADVQSITRSYRIFALVLPQAQIAAAADKIVTMTATLSEMGTKLKSRLDTAATAGKDVSALQSMLAELAVKITSANTHAQAAVNGTATLTPDEGDKTKMEANKAALQKARDELKAAHEDIKASRALVNQIIEGLKGNASSNVPTSTSVEGQV